MKTCEGLGKKSEERQIGKTESAQEFCVALAEQLRAAMGMLRLAMDQLERLQAEQKADREKYRKLLDLVSIGYLVTDPQGRIQQANRFIGTLFNASPTDIIGKNLVVFIEDAQRKEFNEGLRGRFRIARNLRWKVRFYPLENLSFEAAVVIEAACDENGKVTELHWRIHLPGSETDHANGLLDGKPTPLSVIPSAANILNMDQIDGGISTFRREREDRLSV